MIQALILLALVAAAPFVAERMRPEVGPQDRTAAPGEIAELSDGATWFRWYGPDDGPVIVCIHGLTTPGFVWHRLAQALAAGGARVLTYDLYGRGLSDRPRGAQTRAFFHRQLRELLADQGLDGDLTLFGYSMGGAIATIFAAEEPERLRRLVLFAPAGLETSLRPWMTWAGRVPVVGDWLALGFGGLLLRFDARGQTPSLDELAAEAGRRADDPRRQGYMPAVLSSQRNLLAEDLAEDHRAVAAAGLPVLAIWGRDDRTIPIRAMGRLAALNGQAHHVELPEAGHGLVYTHVAELTEALRRQPGG